MESRRATRRGHWVLAGILVVATLLRVVMLDSPLWFDEIVTLVDSVRLPWLDLLAGNASFNNHPFYSLQAKAIIALFGESSWALRFPAFVFGILGIAATWELARMVSDTTRAHVTALLIAVSYQHVWYSQNARAYTELMFWFTVATILLVRGVRSPSWRAWVGYGLVLAAAVYSHLTAATFFVGQGMIVVAILGVRTLRGAPASSAPALAWSMPIAGFVIGGLASLVLYAPAIRPLLENIMAVPATSAVDVMQEYQSPLWTVLEIVRSFARPGPFVLAGAALFTGLVGIGLVGVSRREPVVGATVVVHIPLTLVLLLATSGRVWPRFFFADMGFVLLFLVEGVFVVCARACAWLRDRTSREAPVRAAFLVAAGAMVVLSCVLLVRNYRHPKQDFAGALAFIEQQRAAADAVVTLGLASLPYEAYFETGWPAVESVEELAGIRSRAERTWLVMTFPSRTGRRYADVMVALERDFSLARRFPGTLGDGDVLVYVSATRDAGASP